MDRYTQTNEPEGFSQKGLAAWAALLAMLILAIGILTGSVDLITVGNKLFNVALVLVGAVLFNEFYLSRRNSVDAQIFSHPVALALYAGAVVLATAVAVSG